MFTDQEKEIIEKLKDNLAKFFENTNEEKAVFKKVGKNNCEWLNDNGKWKSTIACVEFVRINRYRIKPDYKIEPEYEDKEIKPIDGILQIVCSSIGKLGLHEVQIIPLSEIVEKPGFVGFVSESGWVRICEVATKIHSGKTIYARLRR